MILALADDFSGAAEVAGVAHRHGLKAMVTSVDPLDSKVDFVGVDMATRSLVTEKARQKAETWGQIAAKLRPHLLYKKTDSALRGHIALECSVILAAIDRSRGLLIPSNPARGRTISHGKYHINNIPLADTEFARDPAFPIHSSNVTDLVIGSTSLSTEDQLPASGLAVGDTSTEEDLINWAAKTNEDTLPAGASPFLAALLKSKGNQVVASIKPRSLLDRHILLVCGSQSDNAKQTIKSLRGAGKPVFETSHGDVEHFATRLRQTISTSPLTVLCHPQETNYSSKGLTERIAAITSTTLSLFTSRLPHLCLEGGETAAAVLRLWGKESFSVLHEWESGVVTLVTDNQLPVTVKPGSYPWPTKLFGPRNPA
jgi:D-threonate/D-erythronate kinase